jgi:hypothetical protein
VKVLFIGEGNHDIGPSTSQAREPRPAQGSIPILARRVCPVIAAESAALAWTEIHRFRPAAKKTGFAEKVLAAAFLAEWKFGCAGTVVVADKDGDPDRKHALEDGQNRANKMFPKHRLAWGLAVQSVEAWTLGVVDKIAEVLDVDVEKVEELFPRGVHVEALSQNSGKEDHRPKRLLQHIAELGHRDDSTQFRQDVAAITDTAILEEKCPEGFRPFAARLRQQFGSSLS